MPLPLAPLAAAAIGNIGSMAVNIVGDTKGFQSAVKTTSKIAKEGGKKMTDAFQNIGDAVEKTKGAVTKLGSTISGWVSLVLGPSQVLNSVLGTMEGIWGAMGDQIVGKLMPAIRPFIELMLDINREVLPELLPAIGDLAQVFGNEIAPILKDFVVPAFKDLAELMVDVIEFNKEIGSFEIAKGAIIGLALVVTFLTDQMRQLFEIIKAVHRAWEEFQRSVSGSGAGSPIAPFGPAIPGGDLLNQFFSFINPLR